MLILALGVTGCGRLGFGEDDPSSTDEGGGNMTVGVVDATARAPAVCERLNNLATVGANVDLALATTPTGLSAFWVPTAGGSLSGVDIGTNRAASLVSIVKVGAFTASSAAYLDGQLVAGGISTSRALVHSVPQPLAGGTEIGNFDGEFVGKTTLTHSNGDRVTATSCSSGLTVNAFDNAWNGSPATFTVNTSQSVSIDLTPIGAQSLAVWSTASTCHYETVTSKTTGTARQTASKACQLARLTSNGTEVAMVFEEGTKTGLVIDDATTLSAVNAVYANGARSPRVLWDGAHYWVSYLDATDHVVIGYVDEYGMTLTTQLPDKAPTDKAYELGMLDGQPWLFAVGQTDSQLTAARLCVPAI